MIQHTKQKVRLIPAAKREKKKKKEVAVITLPNNKAWLETKKN